MQALNRALGALSLGFLVLSGAPVAAASSQTEVEYSTLTPVTTERLDVNYVSNGQDANAAETQWVAYLSIANYDGSAATCTGSLVDAYWILTARHCVAGNPRYINAAMGANKVGRYAVDRYESAPNDDAVLLHLKNPVTGVSPVVIAPQRVALGTKGLQFGWGGNHAVLQESFQTITENCVSRVSSTSSQFTSVCGEGQSGPQSYKTAYQAGVNEPGDSGGPLVVNGQLVGTLIGGNDSGSFFVVLSSLADWLRQTAGITPGQAGSIQVEYPYESRVQRIYGPTRVETSLNLSRAAAYTGDALVLATGRLAPDALSASGLAGAVGAPIILSQSDPVENQVMENILSSGKHHLYVVGGQVKLSTAQLTTLQNAGISVTPLVGATRYETAAQVGQYALEARNRSGDFDVFLVDAHTYPNMPDALSVGATAATRGGVVIYTRGQVLPAQSAEALNALAAAAKAKGLSPKLWAVGGNSVLAARNSGYATNYGAVGFAGYAEISGLERYDTNALVLATFGPAAGPYLVASGAAFPDGLAAAGYAVPTGAGVLLTRPGVLPTATTQFVKTHPRAQYIIVGGEAAVSRQVANTIGSYLLS